MEMYQGIVTPTVLYGCEVWTLNAKTRKWINVLAMKCPRTIARVKWYDRLKDARVRVMCVNHRSLWRERIKGCFNGLVMWKE